MSTEFELDHIGIAVDSLEEGSRFWQALGFKEMTIEEVASEKVKVGFLGLANNCSLELLESSDENGAISKFIAKKGQGIHHICLRVKDIEATIAKLLDQGVRLIHEKPFRGAHNCLVAFVHPKSTGGVLLELSQPAGESDA